MDLLENPFVIFLLTIGAAGVGALLMKVIDGQSRMAAMEASLGHVLADQKAHEDHAITLALHGQQLEQMTRMLGRLERQNRAIWGKLSAVTA